MLTDAFSLYTLVVRFILLISLPQSSLTAKAQRKVIREIKTARTFGLMPFTSMGKSPFRFLRSRLDDEEGSNINY